MTSAILRRNSSKQGLQNLIRLTAQWSVEDEEEAARERRRRERERQLRSQAEEGLNNSGTSSENRESVQEIQFDGKPSGPSELEEDEGFSDWSQKLEQRKQKCAEEGTREEQVCQWKETQQAAPTQREERFLRHSYTEEDSGLREAEVKLEQVHLDQKPDSPTIIQFGCRPSNFLKFVPASPSFNQSDTEAEVEGQQKLSEVVDVREEIQDTGFEAANQCVAQENECEEDEKEKQEEKKRRRNEEEEAPGKRQRAPSNSSSEEEFQPPLSPIIKITDRTESLNRSIERSNSVKKTQTPLPVSKIDDRLEQYTHAIESSSKTPKPARQLSIDLPTNSAVVASTKSLWETGEVAVLSPVKTTPSKDIVAGDIVSKRSIWEQKETPKADGSAKVQLPGKKYKYVAIGHGQYKKVLIDETTEK
ncbi:lymphocyte-specific protein 1 isoform X2 [Sphaerodactylus townsendi]|uniref:lymphocyte-specific protein 1 isoform X2 n=1 Tax=Sphaerodactylus townsendi TaxID=933632 RepID=UPI0020260AF0|nr:lymphocyte-specific protein 1 isoform X2 [Sphaerodactylus townsendi]